MERTSAKRTVCNIGETVRKHIKHIVPGLLAAHALTGCDTTACMWGVGKSTVINTLTKGHTLQKLGDLQGESSTRPVSVLIHATVAKDPVCLMCRYQV